MTQTESSFPGLEESAARVKPTMGNPQWIARNRQALLAALPTDWTPVASEMFRLRFGFAIKLLGVEWREQADVVVALMWLQQIGLCEGRVDPHGQKGNPRSLIIRRCAAA